MASLAMASVWCCSPRTRHGATREALAGLTRLADAQLRDAGHNPTPDTMRRITTTLEALSAYSSLPDAPRPGRLTGDVDPPGFESLAALMPGAGQAKSPAQSTRVIPFQPGKREEARQARQPREAKIALAKAALEAAEQALLETRTVAQNLEA